MAGKRLTNPAGSSNDLRGDVLRVLGVLKVATADQIQRIAAPHLTYRHTMKATASERKTARTASHAGALSDLRKHGLAENGGTTRVGETLRNLTTKGLEAASYELGRPLTEMGSTARGAGSSGATHPMAVNETVIAMLRPKPDLRLLTGEPAEAKAAAQAAVDAPAGIGAIASYATEVPLPATGTWGAPGKGGAQADIAGKVIRASLRTASTIIKRQGGEIRSYDGDRVMGIFIGNSKNSDVAKVGLQIHYAIDEIVKSALYAELPELKSGGFVPEMCVGIASGEAFIARAGVRDSSDLVSIGRAPNVAAKLSDIREPGYGYRTYITADVYGWLNEDSKLCKGVDMWNSYRPQIGGEWMTIYRSSYWWSV
ncbi:hypothetical protein [Streptomyces sp. CB00455]|uniref:hypothetical protein n=1 Tax=Streptomyces sp. CB00455 TaxID=1703927 RepID=UPI0018FE7034|nr:hypothetical protein [Streptomyces sp. CB00455]